MGTVTEWFDSVYTDPLYLSLYEQDDDGRAADEARGAMRLLAPTPGARWLDVACGFGRHAEHLTAAGLCVVGVDRSPLMLHRAQVRAQQLPSPPGYVRGDLRTLPVRDSFECASLFFDSFGYFTPDVQHQDALFSLAGALTTHGRLIVHLSNRERLVAELPTSEVEQRGHFRVTKQHHIDLVEGLLESTLTIEGDGTLRKWPFRLRLFTASELRNLCECAGFDDILIFGDWEGAPYGPKSPFLILTARKAAFQDIQPLAD
jgi:SAM-dependent methyltransferase